MAKIQHENLFLLEFLVDELNMELGNRCDCMNQAGEICISFQFLDNETLDVCEGDFNCGNKFGESADNKTGKSCLFSLTPAQAQKALHSFDILVNVVKKMPEGVEPRRSTVGSAIVPVLPLFKDLIGHPQAATAAKVLQQSYPLFDAKKEKSNVGQIGVYIRLSCYGKMIITQFQMNMDDKSVLFKDKDGQALYRYKKTKGKKLTKIEDVEDQECGCPQQRSDQDMANQRGHPYPEPSAFPPQPGYQYQPHSPQQYQPGQPYNPYQNQPCPYYPSYPQQQQWSPPRPNLGPSFPDYGPQMQNFEACPAASRACQVKFASCGGSCGRG